MSKYHIGKEEYEQIIKRLDLNWELINHPVKGKTPNIIELARLSDIAQIYEDKVIWDKYKEKFWKLLFEDLKE